MFFAISITTMHKLLSLTSHYTSAMPSGKRWECISNALSKDESASDITRPYIELGKRKHCSEIAIVFNGKLITTENCKWVYKNIDPLIRDVIEQWDPLQHVDPNGKTPAKDIILVPNITYCSSCVSSSNTKGGKLQLSSYITYPKVFGARGTLVAASFHAIC